MAHSPQAPGEGPNVDLAALYLPASVEPGEAPFDWAFGLVAGLPLVRRNLMALASAGFSRVHLIVDGDGGRGAWSALAADSDRRLPEIDMGPADDCATVLMLDGRRLFQPALLAEAASLRTDTVYLDEAGRPAGMAVVTGIARVPWTPGSAVLPGAVTRTIGGRSPAPFANTPAARRDAERALLASLVKDTDGWVSRHLNRPLSTRVSAVLARHAVPPDAITLAGFLVALVSAYASTLGTYTGFAVGGVLFHLASVVDGVDGEVARLTFRTSRQGQWLDTVADDASNFVYFSGLTVGVWRAFASPVLLSFGIATVVFDLLAVAFLYWHLVTHFEAGSLLAYQPSLEQAATRSPGHWLARRLQFMARRDSYALLIMGVCLAGVAWVTLVVTPVVIVSVVLAAAFLVRRPAAWA